jgi:Family of unknown function (DUF6502)
MARRRSRGRSRRAEAVRTRTSTLDALAVEAVIRFVRVLARRGCTPQDIGQEVLNACREVPKSWAQNAMAAVREMDAAAHVLTLWFSDPAYLDSRGNPLPLPLRGGGRSLEALVLRVDRRLDAQEVLRHLLRREVLRRVRSRYLPRDRLVSFRGSGAPYHSRSVRGLVSMLRTLEHNSEPQRSTPGWFEVIALNSRFPVKAREAFDKRVRHLGMHLLSQFDADMHRRERARKRGERTVPLGVGIYLFEEEPLPPGRRRVKRAKRARR